MGRCPCFGRRNKNVRNDENENQNPALNVTNSDKSSVALNKNVEPKSGASVSKDRGDTKNAMTFSYRELAKVTNNFRQDSIIGEGGFGPVYKGKLETTGQIVAVKKLNHSGLQGDKEFLVEVLMLSLLRHPNLVNLIGYCAEGDQRLLVYELMPLGSLEDHLHDLDPESEPLDWNTRMMIAAGAAKGLNFLHNEAEPPVIYRDLKSSNILLDEGFYPKLSDFGLAKFGPKDDKSHVSTRVMGTEGYCAPEYAATGKLTVKSDIYSFGVVLLELITGCRPLDLTRGNEKHMLVDWARPMLKDPKKLISLADPLLRGQFPKQSLSKAMEVVMMCLHDDPQSRPNMNDVVEAMNYLAARKYQLSADDHRTDASPTGQRNEGSDNIGNLEETRLLVKVEDRQRAVAEAKMWGETCRDKSRLNPEADTDDLDQGTGQTL